MIVYVDISIWSCDTEYHVRVMNEAHDAIHRTRCDTEHEALRAARHVIADHFVDPEIVSTGEIPFVV